MEKRYQFLDGSGRLIFEDKSGVLTSLRLSRASLLKYTSNHEVVQHDGIDYAVEATAEFNLKQLIEATRDERDKQTYQLHLTADSKILFRTLKLKRLNSSA